MNYSERAKARRDKLKAEGLCIDCGTEPSQGARCAGCLERQREKNKRWSEKNREKLREKNRQWYFENKDASKGHGKKYRMKLRSQVIEVLGGRCACCGETQHEWLHVDHKNKDGKKHRNEVGRSTALYRDILANPARYELRVLCANCHNAITSFGYCPHERLLQIPQDIPSSLESGRDQ